MGVDTLPLSSDPLGKPKRPLWKRAALWCATVVILLLLAIFGLLEIIAHRPSPMRMTISTAEIQAEDASLKQHGLVLSDGSFLKEHPFQPPWTSHSLLVPPTWSGLGIKYLLAPHQVRADLLLADLDTLQPVMQRAYGGWDSAAARGWNWNQWFAAWRTQLAAKGTATISYDEAFAPIDTLLAFQRDNHTQIPLNRYTGDGSQTALLASAPTAPCTEVRTANRTFPIAANDPGQQVRTAKLWRKSDSSLSPTHYISMPTSYGTPQSLHCGDTWIPLQPIVKHGGGMSAILHELWTEAVGREHPHIERIADGIVYARLPTFTSSNYEQVSQQGWPQRTPSDHVLIVDLRNNGGEDADYGLNLLKGWIDEARMVPFDHIAAQVNSSCLYAPFRWNEAVQSTPTILPSQKQFFQQMLDRMAQPYPPDCPRAITTTQPQWTYLQHHFAPAPNDLRILALVNSHCGSDCELLTAMLASLPETLVVGDNTYGVCQQIQPGYSVLPHTGLRYRIALGRSDYYGDNRSVDGYGLDVDVVLPEVDTLNPQQLLTLAATVERQYD